MGCCQSTPDVPDDIIPDPLGPSKFVVESCSMFNSDYEVYQDSIDKVNRWLFLNKEGKAFSSDATIFLENYTRKDPENPKRGQILWSVKYDESPDYKQEYDSDSSGDSDMSLDDFFDIRGGGRRHTHAMKWKMKSKAKFKPGIREGIEYRIQCKAKGTATRRVHYSRDADGNRQKHYDDDKKIKKITYKVTDEQDNLYDKFKCEGKLNNDRHLEWDCLAFNAQLGGGFFSPEPAVIVSKPGADPALALLMGHMVTTEFRPGEILGDLHPDWRGCLADYNSDYDSD